MEDLVPRVLVVDDERDCVEMLGDLLEAAGIEPTIETRALWAFRKALQGQFDAILLDINMPNLDGLRFLETLKRMHNEAEVIMVSARSEPDVISRALALGAFDFIQKPVPIQHLLASVRNALGRRTLSLVEKGTSHRELVGEEEAGFFAPTVNTALLMCKALRLANRFSALLVSGPPGSGKEAWIHLLHSVSSRGDTPLVRFDCSKMSPDLQQTALMGSLESETGRGTYFAGHIKRADGGILWLENVESLSDRLQQALLAYIESGNIEFPGMPSLEFLDVLIIGTTEATIPDALDGTRDRFIQRLRRNHIEILGLSARRDEILDFARLRIARRSREQRRPIPCLSQEAAEILVQTDFQRNLDDLFEIIDTALNRCGEEILPADISETKSVAQPAPSEGLRTSDSLGHLQGSGTWRTETRN